MPFSTYLRDSSSRDDQQQQSHPIGAQFNSQEQYPGYAVFPPPPDAWHYQNYTLPPPAPPALNSGPSPASSSSNSSDSIKNYILQSPSESQRSSGADGLFQMPSFLMGNFAGTLAPGGGAEVLTPNTGMGMGMFDFVSSSYGYGPPPATPACVPPGLDRVNNNGGKQPSWQTTKYYTLEVPEEQVDDGAESASASTANHAHPADSSAPAASPFGYLNTESPQHDQISNASVQQQETMDDSAATKDVPADDSSAITTMPTQSDARTHRSPDNYAPVPTIGLPVYSQSGFDMLSILARVARRANQTISLGPVDFSCAFVVSDVRRADAPIVYASPTFCALTGYPENEVVGRNCRFLQAPGGRVVRSDIRRFTSPDAVRELRFALDKDREVQVSLINYRKDSSPFVNRVSIVPIPGEDDGLEIAFHVGFQVDLNEQPGLIRQRIQDGKFYTSPLGMASFKPLTPSERSSRGMGKKLRALLSDSGFQSAAPLTTSCNSIHAFSTFAANINSDSSAPTSNSSSKAASSSRPDARDERQWMNLLLLEYMPDFVHVLSLKGHFLYVSPGITHVLGYAPSDLLGKAIGDVCHPSDAVPLLRELKESTGLAVLPNEGSGAAASNEAQDAQRVVDLLFRMRTKAGGYAWVESIGRMHVEAGKGRKAIVLSGRICAMPNLRWGSISHAGGLLASSPCSPSTFPDDEATSDASASPPSSKEREFWAMLCDDGLFLVAGVGVRDLLGWGTGEMIGRSIRDFVLDDEDGDEETNGSCCATVEQVIVALRKAYGGGKTGSQCLACKMKKRNGEALWMQLVLYASEPPLSSSRVIVQFKSFPPTPASTVPAPSPSSTYGYSPPVSATYQNSPFAYPFAHPVPSIPSSSSSSFPYALSSSSLRTGTGTGTGRILHVPTTNVFAEFETHRGTSWQYELQQLKFANDKLREEVGVLEARQRQNQNQNQNWGNEVHKSALWTGEVRA